MCLHCVHAKHARPSPICHVLFQPLVLVCAAGCEYCSPIQAMALPGVYPNATLNTRFWNIRNAKPYINFSEFDEHRPHPPPPSPLANGPHPSSFSKGYVC